MSTRQPILKTYKLFIGGAFPRTESGRSDAIADAGGTTVAHLCRSSRKDLRIAVEAAEVAQPKWAGANAYLRGQILYRIAEMLEGKRRELIDAICSTGSVDPDAAATEVDLSTDRLVAFAGWADKYQQILGCQNPVSGPYHNFSMPEPTGVVVCVCPDEFPLLGLVTLLAPPLCAGNAVIAIASNNNPIPACVFAEACATGDVPGGTINILTGHRGELVPHVASHRGINAVHAAAFDDDTNAMLRAGAAENLKRVHLLGAQTEYTDAAACEGPWAIEAFTETKTIWHPSAV